jgi:hypothetical protein
VIVLVLLEQFIAEPQDLRLVRNVTGMAGDRDTGRGARPHGRRGRRDGVRVDVTRRDRTAMRRQLTDKLAANARAAPGHYRELAGKGVHGVLPYLPCHCLSTLDGARMAGCVVLT